MLLLLTMNCLVYPQALEGTPDNNYICDGSFVPLPPLAVTWICAWLDLLKEHDVTSIKYSY